MGGSGRFSWQDILVDLFGGSVWHIYLAGFISNGKDKLLSKKREEKKCIISESVDCIMSLYSILASNIVLFCSRCRFN